MDWKELFTKARDLYAKAAETEDGDERKSLIEQAEDAEGRAEAAKKAADIDAEEKAWSERQPVENGGYVIEDEVDRKAKDPELEDYKSFGDQLMDIYRAGPGGRKPTPRLLKAHQEAYKAVNRGKAISGASELVPPDGGFLVQEDFAGMLVKPDMMSAPIMSRCRRIPLSAGANSTRLYGVAETDRGTGNRWGGIQGYWLAEADQITSSHPTFRQIRLEPHKVAALAYATDEVLSDAAQLEAVIGQSAREELVWLVENAIINGTGAGQPLGIMNAPCVIAQAIEVGQAADTVVAENVINMWARRYVRGSYVWFISQDVFPQLIQMDLAVGTGGALVFMPPGGLSGGQYGTLFGAPVIEIEYADNLGDTGDIILADMNQYLLCDKGSVQSAQSIHIRFDYDEMCFRFIYRVDGQPAWNSAITPANDGDTVGPFIYLAERA